MLDKGRQETGWTTKVTIGTTEPDKMAGRLERTASRDNSRNRCRTHRDGDGDGRTTAECPEEPEGQNNGWTPAGATAVAVKSTNGSAMTLKQRARQETQK